MALFSLFNTDKNTDNSISRDIDTANFRIIQLEKKVNELAFTVDTLWELLAEHNNFNESTLQEKILAKKKEIESRTGETTTCSSCNRIVPVSKDACYYCGSKLT
jgi:rRNA maturation endonuclease Nob1